MKKTVALLLVFLALPWFAIGADFKISDKANIAKGSLDSAYELLLDTGSDYNALTLAALLDWLDEQNWTLTGTINATGATAAYPCIAASDCSTITAPYSCCVDSEDFKMYLGTGSGVTYVGYDASGLNSGTVNTNRYSAYADLVAESKIGTDSTIYTDATTVAAADGGTGIDTSSSTGFPSIAAGTWSVIKHNLAAAVDPADTDDGPDGGYSVGSLWINTTDDRIWQCVDSTDDAAIWQPLGPALIDDTAGDGTTNRAYSADKIIDTYMPFSGGAFTSFPTTPSSAPTTDYQVANKKYVDDTVGSQGTMAAQDASNVEITGGSISGVTMDFGTLSDNGYKGTTYEITAGEALTAYQLVASRDASGTTKAFKYDNDDADKALKPYGIAVASADADAAATILLTGLVRNSGWGFAAGDTGKTVYASDTDGGITLTKPTEVGDYTLELGVVIDGANDIIWFNPDFKESINIPEAIVASFNPQDVYDNDSTNHRLTLEPLVPSTFTITRLYVQCDANPTTEPTLTFKECDGGVGCSNASTIEAVQTSDGVANVTSSIDDSSIAAGHKIVVELSDPDDALVEVSVRIEGRY